MAEVKSRTATKKTAPAAKKPVAAKSASKVVAKTTTAKSAAPQKAPAKNPANPKGTPAKKGNAVSAEQRYRMIAEAAYYIAEKRGFAPGDPAKDWAEAESQIGVMFSA